MFDKPIEIKPFLLKLHSPLEYYAKKRYYLIVERKPPLLTGHGEPHEDH